ncbi:hypothetical protein AAFG22_14720 [Bradyrhizobium sp. B024]|uniref:hypothetical protein n=1 Tax=Bradyrhizobium sp. B024 TaxID=3140247 RepID=UPI003183076F
MTEIRIDAEKAERILSQTLRDNYGLPPAKANEAAAEVMRRFNSSMPTPTNQPFQNYRLIQSRPPSSVIDPGLWKRVYDLAEELPPGIADALK